jgi:DNA replication protein DnaC
MSQTIDAARLTLLLNDLRLPAIKQGWAAFAERADKEGWPAARFLASLAEHEIAERDRRRIERHLVEARLLPGKTLDAFEFEAVPMLSKAHVMAICAGNSWIDKGANLILRNCKSRYRKACAGDSRVVDPPSTWLDVAEAYSACCITGAEIRG